MVLHAVVEEDVLPYSLLLASSVCLFSMYSGVILSVTVR